MGKKIIVNEKGIKRLSLLDTEELNYVVSKQLLDEGLIKSYDADSVIRMFKRELGGNECVELIEKYRNNPTSNDEPDFDNESTIRIFMKPTVTRQFIGQVKKFMNTCGWLSCTDEKFEYGYCTMEFDPKFASDATEYVRNNMHYLYHSAPNKVVDRILKQGLTPRESVKGHFQYDGRVYLMMGDSLNDDQIEILNNVINYHKKMGKDEYNNGYSILKVDLDKVPEDVKFYIDAAALDAVYTRNTIPPQAISIAHTAYYNQ